jgi:UDP-glucuronate decarboxylase
MVAEPFEAQIYLARYNPRMKILVTGGAGFLGSHLVDRLMAENHSVIVMDNLYTGSEKNIEHHYSKNNFEFKLHDVTDKIDIEVDQIYNLACPASPIHYQRNPVETTRTAVLGSLNMLELAQKYSARIFLASTSEIYGDPTVSPQAESYFGNVNTTGIRACYDEGKRVSETLFFDYYRQFNVEIKLARIFNTYGPRMDLEDGRVVSNFIVQALTNRPITIYGNGEQTRSFCYVEDLISGIIDFMNIDGGFTGPVNLGNPNDFTMLQLAKEVLRLTNSKSSLLYEPLPSDDPKQRKPDISLAAKELGWVPKVNLSDGLLKTIDEFKMRIGNSKT